MPEPQIWGRPELELIKHAYNHLFHTSLGLSKIKDAAIGGRLYPSPGDSSGVPGRSMAWKLFLCPPIEPLQPNADFGVEPYLEALRTARKDYRELLLERMKAPDGSYEDGLVIPGSPSSPPKKPNPASDLELNNPLSLHVENPWKEWFQAMELRKTIAQDVERTFPDFIYFRDVDVQAQLTNILYVWSILNPAIGYRQGMHELLATLYYAVDYDSIGRKDDLRVEPGMAEFCSRIWVAGDAWALFVQVMNGVGQWYEWREPTFNTPTLSSSHHARFPPESGQLNTQTYLSPIVKTCNDVQSTYLKTVDPQLWKSMQAAGIEPQIYGIRWLRLLFTREFGMSDAMVLWDGLFAADPTFELAKWVCVAMLVRIRNQLIPSDYTGQLTSLLRYPPTPAPDPDEVMPPHPSSVLIRQALNLQMYPTPTSGTSVVVENRNLFNIPMEVPEPPPPPMRRQARNGDRSKSNASNSQPGSVRSAHGRNMSTQGMYLPEIARGLLDRGESLGINKSFMDAVSGLRRNIPDLAATAAQTAAQYVRTPTTPGSGVMYQLMGDKSPDERSPSPLEQRARLDITQEISELKARQRLLGDSVGWIVDTLLQDEGDAPDKAKADALKARKRAALESLAYVRDVLQGGVTKLEDDRLWNDEELQKRRVKKPRQPSRERQPVTNPLMSPTPSVAGTSAPPSLRSFRGISTHPTSPVPRGMERLPITPSFTPTHDYAQPLSPGGSFPPTPSVLSPNADGTQLASWRSKRDVSPAVPRPLSAPRVAATSPSAHRAPYAPSTFSKATSGESRAQRKMVGEDPLGALH